MKDRNEKQIMLRGRDEPNDGVIYIYKYMHTYTCMYGNVTTKSLV
jgi:hypothetical protein